ncbi:hypothetical protein ACFVU2_15365 [Leifsonia sp. NPDC058194]|uniref:hypothetical protein n=1 Tax=Leifsonia sp. NPDC058194 TaxID=3346374 RepID=UPI0036DA9243
MSFDEKNAWVFLSTAVLGYAVYLVLLAALGIEPYAALLLWTVGGAIAANILARIVLSMIFPRGSRERDQRDRQVLAFGERVGQAFVILGAVAALLLALIETPWFWIANAVYLGFVLSAVVGSIASLVAYRTGLPSW